MRMNKKVNKDMKNKKRVRFYDDDLHFDSHLMLDDITPSEVREAQRFINQQLLLRRRNSPDLKRGSRSLQVTNSHNITTAEFHVHHPETERFIYRLERLL